ERRFVRPSLLQLVDALDEAARRVNAGGALFDIDRDGGDAVVAGTRGCPEGVPRWPRVRLAWWTDAGGGGHLLGRAGDRAGAERRHLPRRRVGACLGRDGEGCSRGMEARAVAALPPGVGARRAAALPGLPGPNAAGYRLAGRGGVPSRTDAARGPASRHFSRRP